MSNELSGFHHLGIVSREMDAAIGQYERLGFRFSPLSVPKIPLRPGGEPEPLGAANRCAIFRDNYLEVLGIIDPARWASITAEQRGPYDLDRPLSRYEGLHVLHLASDDLAATRARLDAGGLHPSEIRPFQRMVDTPEGPKLMRAKALSFPPGSNPEALLQIAQHETPELVLQPRLMDHANGARSLSEAIVCVDDPESVAARYAVYAARSSRKAGDVRIVDVGSVRILVVDADHLQTVLPGVVTPTLPFLAGFTVIADLAKTEHVLRQNAVAGEGYGGRILVRPRDAAGSAVLFERADAAR